jgi:hypothetical protein
MPFSQGSRTGLAFVPEVTFGTTPTTPAMVDLPYNSHSLDLSKSAVTSGQIRPDRQVQIFRHGQRQVGGAIECEFRADAYDDLLESACFGAFSSSVLKVGVTPKFFTIEERNLDITQYRRFTGCGVSSLSINCTPNQMVTATFNMVGKDMALATSPLDASIDAAPAEPPFDAFSATISEGGSTVAIVTAVNFTIDNALSPTFVVGAATTPQMEYGMANVTGEISVYFENQVLYNKFINETESSLTLALADGNDTYTFEFHKIKYSGGNMPVQNPQSRILTLPFVALLDTTEGTNLTITKS